MNAFGEPGEQRATLVRVVADRDHIVEVLTGERIQRLGRVPADVDPELAHRLDRQRLHTRFLSSGAEDFEPVAGHVTQQSLGHLAAGRVVRAEEENAFCGFAGIHQGELKSQDHSPLASDQTSGIRAQRIERGCAAIAEDDDGEVLAREVLEVEIDSLCDAAVTE